MSWKVIKPIPFNLFEINGVKYKSSLELVARFVELEKENAELKEQAEKMKCCQNCDNNESEYSISCWQACKNKDQWKLRSKPNDTRYN